MTGRSGAGPNRDAIAPGDGLLEDWPAGGPPRLWTARGGEGFSSFAIADGKLVTQYQDGGDEVTVCLDAENKGKELVKINPGRFEQDGVGPRATPTIEGRTGLHPGGPGRSSAAGRSLTGPKSGARTWPGISTQPYRSGATPPLPWSKKACSSSILGEKAMQSSGWTS